MAGTIVAALLIAPLVVPGYMLGSWRWLRRTRNYWEISLLLAIFFLPWYVILRTLDGSQALVPVAMLALAAGLGAGRFAYLRRRRHSS